MRKKMRDMKTEKMRRLQELEEEELGRGGGRAAMCEGPAIYNTYIKQDGFFLVVLMLMAG